MEQAYGNTQQPWFDLGISFHLQTLSQISEHSVTKVLAYSCRMLDVALFWFFVKHTGRSHVFVEMI
jgi:hypothetical protein